VGRGTGGGGGSGVTNSWSSGSRQLPQKASRTAGSWLPQWGHRSFIAPAPPQETAPSPVDSTAQPRARARVVIPSTTPPHRGSLRQGGPDDRGRVGGKYGPGPHAGFPGWAGQRRRQGRYPGRNEGSCPDVTDGGLGGRTSSRRPAPASEEVN